MQYNEFVGQVQHRARLASQGESVRAIQATLETLSERITESEAEDLAAQLPAELAHHLRSVETSERFPLQDFFLRTAAKESADLPDAAFHARVVIDVLDEALSAGELADVRAQLPESYAPLFEAGSEGDLNL